MEYFKNKSTQNHVIFYNLIFFLNKVCTMCIRIHLCRSSAVLVQRTFRYPLQLAAALNVAAAAAGASQTLQTMVQFNITVLHMRLESWELSVFLLVESPTWPLFEDFIHSIINIYNLTESFFIVDICPLKACNSFVF